MILNKSKKKYKKTKIIRFVDFIGDINDLEIIKKIANNLFEKEKIEYIDFYTARLPMHIRNLIKFKLVTKNDKNIIPDYFDPFVEKNVNIFFETINIFIYTFFNSIRLFINFF